MKAINSTGILINMSVPIRQQVNGIILRYEVTIWTTEDDPITMIANRSDDNERITQLVVGGLRKFFNHSVTIKAFTKFGLGVASSEMVIETLEEGNQ